MLPVYTQSNKILLDLGEKHPELKKIPFYPQKKGVGALWCLSLWCHCNSRHIVNTRTSAAAKLSDLKDASQ